MFLIYANDWDNYKEVKVEYSRFADDLYFYGLADEDVEKARERMEKAAGKIEFWAKKEQDKAKSNKIRSLYFYK